MKDFIIAFETILILIIFVGFSTDVLKNKINKIKPKKLKVKELTSNARGSYTYNLLEVGGVKCYAIFYDFGKHTQSLDRVMDSDTNILDDNFKSAIEKYYKDKELARVEASKKKMLQEDLKHFLSEDDVVVKDIIK